MTDQDRYEALRATKLAAELTDDQCRVARAASSTLRDLKQGEVLAREGTVDNHLYVILARHAGRRQARRHRRRDHDQHALRRRFRRRDGLHGRHRGSTRRRSRSATRRVLGLEREKLESLLATDPLIVYRVMRAIIRVVHQIQRRLSMQQVELSNYIYKQHGRY